MNRQLGQFKGHLITFISLSELLDDLDDALRLLGSQTVDLTDQVIALLHRKRLLFKVWRGLGLNLGCLDRSVVWCIRLGLRWVVDRAGICRLLRLSCCRLLSVLFLQQTHLLLQLLDLDFLTLQLSGHFSIIGIH